MELGIQGEVKLHFTDRVTGKVETQTCFNLITKYGLKRFLAPKNLSDQTVTHICVGYRVEDPSVEDDLVPSNYCAKEVSESLFARTTLSDNNSSSYQTVFGDDMPVGFRFNHMCLAYKDENGELHALTSLKLKNNDGSIIDYTHTSRYNVGVHYSLVFNLTGTTGKSTYVTGVTLLDSQYMYYAHPYLKHELNGDCLYTEASDKQDNPAYIKSFDGYFNDDGNWVQIYNVVMTPRSYSSNADFRFGLGNFRLICTNHRGSEEVEIKFVVRQITDAENIPKPVESVTIKVNGSGYYVEDTRYVLIKGPPYQDIEVYFGKYLLSRFYLGATGQHHTTSRFSKMTDPITNEKVDVPAEYMLSSGYKIRFVSKTRTGMTEVLLDTPDMEANNVKAIWFVGPRTIRAVSNYGDKIQITYDDNVYSSPSSYTIHPIFGECTTEFAEDPGYYYCDINLGEDFDPTKVKYMSYICTDLAGNVWHGTSSDQKYLHNYIPGIDYSNANSDFYSGRIEHDMALKDINNYNFNFRVLSGEII